MTRPATIRDVLTLVAIERECFGTDAWSERLVREEVLSDRHVVRVAGDLDAYAAISLAGDVADLERIATRPAARGRGRARELLEDVLDDARDRGAERMLLEVAADNAVAVALYESCGFATIATRRAYYAGGVDALVMELAITEWR
jgi:ribosomal-protein-alanine N-acetyltransferase